MPLLHKANARRWWRSAPGIFIPQIRRPNGMGYKVGGPPTPFLYPVGSPRHSSISLYVPGYLISSEISTIVQDGAQRNSRPVAEEEEAGIARTVIWRVRAQAAHIPTQQQ